MIRLAIALVHTVLALGTTSGGALVLSQGRANATWEQAFYGEITTATAGVLAAGVFALLIGVGHVVSAGAWFVGAMWGGVVLIALGLLMAASAPWSLALLLFAISLLVALDLMVERHRAREAPPAG